jgi:amidohydrolase family protein
MPGSGAGDCPAGSGPGGTSWDWIDTHAHPFATPGQTATCVDAACLEAFEATLGEWGVRVSFMMPMPAPAARTGEDDVATQAKAHADRYGFLNGGFTLQPLIEEAVEAGSVSADLQSRFDAAADAVAAEGALGYGEMAALHVSFNAQHPFEEFPPDHALFLSLADHAARDGLVLDLHMDLVAQDKETPQELRDKSPNNPSTLKGNKAAFERLLAHNRDATLVWDHVGWDNTDDQTIETLRALLAAHPNLVMQLKGPMPPPVFEHHNVLDSSGTIRPEWLDLIQDYPDRFVVGSDVFYSMPEMQVDMGLGAIHDLLAQLPGDLREKVGIDNPTRIYGLSSGSATGP